MTISEALDAVSPIEFKYNGSDKKTFGFSAQALASLFPQEKYSLVTNDENGYMMVDYSQMTTLLLAYCKDLSKKVDALQAEVNELKKGR